MIKIVIFDFDGTLGDTRRNIIVTMQETLRVLDYPVVGEEDIAATIGLPLEKGFEQLLPGISDIETAKCASTYRAIFERNRKALVPQLFPHVKETLATLHDMGLILSVASSRSSSSLNAFIQEMDIAQYITYVLGADNVSKAKPDPEPVLLTLSSLGFPAEAALVVGDMPVDIQMGKGAGARTCAVTYGNASETALQEAGADFVISDIAQLLEIID